MLPSRFVVGMLSLGLMVLGAGVVFGQDYPNKPIRIVTAAAGGGSDFTARQIAQGMAGPLGQPVIVENRGTLPAAEAVSKALPDGYTLLVQGGGIWLTPLLQKVPYDMADFSTVSLISREVYAFVVHPSLPVKSIKELIALAKARPGKLDYASGNSGAYAHLASELFNSMAGVNIVRIPYKSAAARITAVMSGEVHLTIYDAGVVAPHVKAGRLKALAVTSSTPSALFPGLPTVAETLPGYESVASTGIFAPAKTPGTIINRLNQEVVRFLNRADVKERFLDAGAETVGSSPEEFAVSMKSEMARLGKVIKDAGIRAE